MAILVEHKVIEFKSQEDDKAEIKDCSSERSMGSIIFLNVSGVELSTFFCHQVSSCCERSLGKAAEATHADCGSSIT